MKICKHASFKREERIFYSGDTGYGDHFKEIGKRYGPFDLTFIENGQYNEKWPDVHMQPEESLQAHLDLNGKLFVPVHWGMFDLALHKWNEPVERSYKIATAWDIPIFVPQLGQVVDTGANLVQRTWWRELSEHVPLVQTGVGSIGNGDINVGLKQQ